MRKMSLMIKATNIYEKIRTGDIMGAGALVENLLADLAIHEEASEFYDLLAAKTDEINSPHQRLMKL